MSLREFYVVYGLTVLMIVGFILLYLFVADSVGSALLQWGQVALVGSVVGVSFLVPAAALLRNKGRRRAAVLRDLRAGERALYETVALLRETQHTLPDDWPVLRKERFRIRLSRFAIGPDEAWYDRRTARKR